MSALRWLPLALILALPLVAAEDKKEDKSKPIGTVERLDDKLDDLLDKDATVEKLGDGFAWTEGPVWVKGKDKKDGYLLFSDIPNNAIMKWQEGKKIEVFLEPSGYVGKRDDFKEPGSNGLLIDSEGYLIAMEHGDRRVSRLEIGKKPQDKKTLADKYDGKKLNSPNDGVFAKNGDLYFTDPPYGRMLKKDKDWAFPDCELDFHGVYRLSKKDNKLTLMTKELKYPNGIALSPDEKTLYVGHSDPKNAVWMAYPIEKDGSLGKGKVFFDSSKWVGKKKGLPDGMKVDVKGNLWATGPGGVLVLTPEGKHLGTILTGVNTGNLCFGEDGSTLFIMCDKAIGRIKTKTKGLGF